MTPFWFIGPLTVDTRIALADRYGDGERVADRVLRLWDAADAGRRAEANELAAEARAAEGNVAYPSTNFGEGCTLASMFHATRLMPSDDRLGLDRVSIRDGRGWTEIGAPVASDLDAAGTCRCGCGHVDIAPRSPEFTDHGAAI